MFEQLPETNPHKNKRKVEAFAGAFGLQIVLVAGLIVLHMAMPEKLGEFQLLTTLHMAPPPPPPAAPLGDREKEPEIIAPTEIPRDIARIVQSVPPSGGAGVPGGVAGGVPGGVPGGLAGGVLEGVLGAAAEPPALPPPTEPVRVGGNVKPPQIVHIEQPTYPPAAKRAKVEGVVVLEAVVTAEGTVDKVKVISGPPLLVDAAKEAISRWKYEPTILNGQAVPVILTARINFSLSNTQK